MLSHPSVGRDPESCLRFWRSFVYLRISPYTRNSTLLCLTQVNWFREHSATFWRLSLSTRFTAYVPFTPSHSEEHLPPRLTAAAGTELAGASSSSLVMIAHSTKELYKRHCPSSLTRYCWIGLSPLSKIPHCCPPRESGPCLSPSVADHPKRPAKHHWLGQPLPDQLPNTTQAHQTALFSFLQDLARTVRQIPTLIDILEKLVKSRQTLSKAMVARNGFSQVIDSPYGRLA
ncbi:hypothetical protein OSB04_un000924 [Centaurea solstitialis]|uniref:Uncharacterized protein n=1 Tax=Centaurea solstitialis TaxID=347529 RepID=A0AA38SBN6_9ASTR|nr:hypothetical protein OSB04_un000924 [Centaurea solstitialis]